MTDNRRARLKEWFADKTLPTKEKSYLSQLMGGKASFGEKAARRIESTYSMPVGYLDTPLKEQAKGESNVTPASMGNKRIPLLSYVQAGLWTESQEYRSYDGGMSYLLMDDDCSAGTFALEIEGESMRPKFNPGDKVIIDPDVHPIPGDFVVARDDIKNETVFKKYRPISVDLHGNDVYELVPLNDDFPTLRSATGKLHIVGTMIEHRISRKNHRR